MDRRFAAAVVAALAPVLTSSCGRDGASTPPAARTASSAAPRPAAAYVYVTNEGSGDLTVIDLASLSVAATVPLGKRPRGIQVSPDRTRLYVALSGSPSAPPGVDERTLPPPDRSADGIGEFDVASNRLLRVMKSGTDPEQLAVSADGSRLFVANEDAAQVSVFDVAGNRVVAAIPVGAEPEGVALTPDGKTVYVTSEEAGEVYAIDTATNALVGQAAVGPRPRSIGFLPDGSRAYVTLENDAALALVDAVHHRFDRRIALGDAAVRPMGIAVDPAGTAVYVTSGRYGSLFAIDPRTNGVAWSLAVGARPWGVALTRDGRTAVTANGPSNDVSVVDVASRTVTKKIPAGDRPWGVAIVEPK
jgi:YVTN family beta-propeller protein